MLGLNHKNVVRICILLACAGFCFLCLAGRGVAQTQEKAAGGLDMKALAGPESGMWNIRADQITYDEEKQVYLAEGHVRIYSTDRTIEADWAELDAQKHLAELRGHVSLAFGKNWIRGEHVIWNIEEQTGWVDGGIAYFADTQFYVQGAYIAKTGSVQYELKDGFVTSCDPNSSDWKIQFDKLDVNLDGTAWARGTSFKVGDVPILYAPILALPIETKRQSGFLLPWAGISKLNGADIEVPYYWAIRQDMDATFYARYMEKRGTMGGLEYRITNNTFGEGIWLANYLHDEADRSFLADNGYPFQTKDRYWLRARHNFDLPYEIKGRLDLDMASDRNFLSEFSKGSSAWDYSNLMFREFTGRGILNDKNIPYRESTLYLEQEHESSLVSLDVRYFDQLNKKLEDKTIERMPALSYSILPSWFGDSPLYYTLQSSAVNFWAEKGNTGGRLDLYPRLYYPLHWNNYLDIEPSAGLRATSYAVDWQRDSHDALQGRFLSDVRLEMSSRVNRVYPVDFRENVAVQHAIRPEFIYEYVPDPVQGNLPHFDRLDSNQARHGIRYGFTSFATSKQLLNDPQGNRTTNYLEFARLAVSQAFNFERLDQDISDFGITTPAGEGFSDLTMRLDITPKRFVTLSYETDVSPEDAKPTQQDVFLTLESGRGDTFRLDYQYRKDSIIDEIIGQFNVQILPNLFINTYHDYSINQKELFAQGYGIRYQKGCWAVGIVFEKEATDERIAFTVNLLGLGNFGSGYSFGVPGTMTKVR
jgi:LPS-assembly protein